MAVFNKITYASLQGAKRLEAEYYQPNYMALMAQLCKKPTSLLGRIAFVTDGIHASINYDENSNIYCLSAQSVRDGFFDLSARTMIPSSQHQLNLRTSIGEGDVIISSMGTIGLSAVAYQEMLPANAVRQVLIVRPKDESEFFSYYLATFLNSKYGLFQSLREATGNVQQHLFIDKVVRFRIPQLSIQNKIGEFHKIAERKLISSHKTLNLAEQLLLSELGLQDWMPTHTLAYVRNYSQAARVRRMDAEHFQPKFDEVARHISAYHPQRLSKLTTQIIEAVKFDERQKYRYIEISNVNTSNGEIGYTEREVQELPPNAKIKVKGGELIVSKVRPTRGAIGVVPDDCRDNGVCSSAFVVLDVPSPVREYLQVYLRSTIGRTLLEQPCKGTSYPTIDDADVKALPIPTISTQTQERLSELVSQSRLAREEAKAILEKAKRAVEIAIEKGEDKAMEFLN